jgi:hypothetical protein
VPSSWIATVLDQEQIELTGTIASRMQATKEMPDRPAADVVAELGGRLFLRYLTGPQVTEFMNGSTDRDHWVTPTPISPEHVVDWLSLFAPQVPREHALLLDPSRLTGIRGPAWIRLGQGLEYYLPFGFPQEAIVDVGAKLVR